MRQDTNPVSYTHLIMTSTAQNNIVIKGHKRAADSEGPLLLGGRSLMNEKIYKTMASSGAGSLALGIVVLVTGLVTGILMIVNLSLIHI